MLSRKVRKPAKVVWASLPGTVCNLDCDYCYSGAGKGQPGQFHYSVDHMVRCFEPKRFGGPIFFGGASGGETLLTDGIVDFTVGLLEQGHVVSYTTNMTFVPVIEKFCDLPQKLRTRLELDASLHYLELKKKNKLDVYFDNLRRLKASGISIAIFLCISEQYAPFLQEIHEVCMKEIGLLPIAGMLRDYDSGGGRNTTSVSREVSNLVEQTCDYRQWHLQQRIYGQKVTAFCHAGEFSLNISLANGGYTKCWGHSGRYSWWEVPLLNEFVRNIKQSNKLQTITRGLFRNATQVVGNLFESPDEPVRFEPIGKCPFHDCVCASYLCWGLVPELEVDTHSRTYFHPEFVSKEVWTFADAKFSNSKSWE